MPSSPATTLLWAHTFPSLDRARGEGGEAFLGVYRATTLLTGDGNGLRWFWSDATCQAMLHFLHNAPRTRDGISGARKGPFAVGIREEDALHRLAKQWLDLGV